jgi:hypothetical protein
MKNVFKLFGIIALVAVIGFSMIACDNGGGGGGGGGSPSSGSPSSGSTTRDAKTYTGTADNATYTLKIEDPSRAALTPATNDKYTLTSGSKTSTGTITAAGLTLTLKPSNAQTTFTVTVTTGNGITQITGTITWNDNTTAAAPDVLLPGGASSKNLSPKTYLGRGSYQDTLEFTSASNGTYKNTGRSLNVQGTYTVSGNTVSTTFQYQGQTEVWNFTLGNNDDTLTVQSARGNFKPNVGYVLVNKGANVSAFAGTWNASGGRSCTFTGNNFDYKVNGTTQNSGSFYAAGSTIIFVVSGGSGNGNYTLSGNTLTISNSTITGVDGTYTKGGSGGGGPITASDLILPDGQIWLATHSSGNKEGWIFKANGDLDHLVASSDPYIWSYGEQWKWQLNGTTLTFSQRNGSGTPWSYANVARNGNTLTMDNYTATVQVVTKINP